jgi:hypothetical protein
MRLRMTARDEGDVKVAPLGPYKACGPLIAWTAFVAIELALNKGLAVVAAHKVVAGIVTIAILGSASAAVATGSADPTVWGQQVRAVVTQCKTERTPGERGIGHCVSGFNEQRNDQRAAPTPTR